MIYIDFLSIFELLKFWVFMLKSVVFSSFDETWLLTLTKTNWWKLIFIKHIQKTNRDAKFKRALGVHFWLILQKTFAAFSHWKLKVAQIWWTHQSKALIFYFGIKKHFWVGFLKILSKADKLNLIFWNLGCV